ncbi:MAG: SMP-30/gluconolactonase/LRE family protein [Planctomycetota bacterium]
MSKCDVRCVSMVLIAGMVATCGCGLAGQQKHRPKLFLSLPEYAHLPDGMTKAPDGNIILACPNYYHDQRYPAVLLKIAPDKKWHIWLQMPIHPDTNRSGPMGLEFGPDGNLYVADLQYFWDTDFKSRLIRVNVEDGKPVSTDVVADGFKLANAVRWKGDHVYVSDTYFDLPDKPHQSGIYRFRLDELREGTVHLKPAPKDPHLIAQFTTVPNERKDSAGADGLCFDKRGNLYCSLFGDGAVYKITFDDQGNVASNECIVRDKRLPCGDGMVYDPRRDRIYVADSQNNAIHIIHPDGKHETLWENADADGSTGLLDQPCEPFLYGNRLIISNFDGNFPGLKNKSHDHHHTLSVISLGE